MPQNKASCINIYAKETRRFANRICKGCFLFLHSSRPKPHLRQETPMKTKKLFKTKIVVDVEPKTKEERWPSVMLECNLSVIAPQTSELPPAVIKYNDIVWILNRITNICVSVLSVSVNLTTNRLWLWHCKNTILICVFLFLVCLFVFGRKFLWQLCLNHNRCRATNSGVVDYNPVFVFLYAFGIRMEKSHMVFASNHGIKIEINRNFKLA